MIFFNFRPPINKGAKLALPEMRNLFRPVEETLPLEHPWHECPLLHWPRWKKKIQTLKFPVKVLCPHFANSLNELCHFCGKICAKENSFFLFFLARENEAGHEEEEKEEEERRRKKPVCVPPFSFLLFFLFRPPRRWKSGKRTGAKSWLVGNKNQFKLKSTVRRKNRQLSVSLAPLE